MLKIQPYSYHCHTIFSDGRNTLSEMVRRAKELRFSELGISDHLIVHKNMYQNPSWKYMEQNRATYVYNQDFKSILDKYQRHCDEIRQMAKQENIKLLVGFEVDYFPYNGWEEEFNWFIKQLDYDYLHTGNHFFCSEDYEHIINMTYFSRVCEDTGLYREYIKNHFNTLCLAVNSKHFKFLAHLDYLKRFCGESYSVDMYKDEIAAVLDSLKNTRTAMEISTKGLRKVNDFYPAEEILHAAAQRNIMTVISDDAHQTSELGKDFDKAEMILHKHGITERLKF